MVWASTITLVVCLETLFINNNAVKPCTGIFYIVCLSQVFFFFLVFMSS